MVMTIERNHRAYRANGFEVDLQDHRLPGSWHGSSGLLDDRIEPTAEGSHVVQLGSPAFGPSGSHPLSVGLVPLAAKNGDLVDRLLMPYQGGLDNVDRLSPSVAVQEGFSPSPAVR
jgi:hypothetical protein